MDIPKLAVATVAPNLNTVTTADTDPRTPATALPVGDIADIRPLDIPGALQILIAEVRLAFASLLEADASVVSGAASPDAPVAPPENVTQAAQGVVALLLQVIPDAVHAPDTWTRTVLQAQTALQSGFDTAIDTVGAWREVAPPVLAATRETRALVSALLSDEIPNPLWVRPEWVGLAPRLSRFARRRRNARRRLTDPDHWRGGLDDAEQG